MGFPVPPQVTGHLRARGRLPRLGQAELQCGPQVLMISIQRGDPLRPAGPERLLPRGQRRIPSPVPQPQRALVAPAAQLGQPELADGVQQPVPGRALPLTEQDRLGHQRVDQVGDLPRGDPAHRADRLRRVQVERPGEHRHPPPHGLLRLGQQLIAPLQRRLQRPVLRLAGRAAAGQQLEPRVQPGQDLPRRQRPQPDRGQFDRQRDPVQRPAHPGHRRAVARIDREPRQYRRGPLREQPHRLDTAAIPPARPGRPRPGPSSAGPRS